MACFAHVTTLVPFCLSASQPNVDNMWAQCACDWWHFLSDRIWAICEFLATPCEWCHACNISSLSKSNTRSNTVWWLISSDAVADSQVSTPVRADLRLLSHTAYCILSRDLLSLGIHWIIIVLLLYALLCKKQENKIQTRRMKQKQATIKYNISVHENVPMLVVVVEAVGSPTGCAFFQLIGDKVFPGALMRSWGKKHSKYAIGFGRCTYQHW